MFDDYSVNIKNVLNEQAVAFLEEACGEIESRTKRNTRVDTGKTKSSFQHKIDEGDLTGYIGSNYQNAIWEEFGTGMYAVNGNGRTTPWIYEDEHGVKHYTRGKTPSRAFFKAYNSLKNKIKKMAEQKFGEIK
nr:MAG TPA: putative tail-component [Caudoviricetes sp.]